MSMKASSPCSTRGQSMIELALILPLLLVLVLGAVDLAQVLSTRQRLEQAAYVAALRLRSAPDPDLTTFVQKRSGLAGATAGATYSLGYSMRGAWANQVVVTATYDYPLLLPGLARRLTWPLNVSASSIAATDPPTVIPTGGTVQVVPPNDNTVPAGPTPLALTCALYQNGTPVPTPQPCAQATPATWSHPPAVATTYTYTATVMQVNGVTSRPSTPVTGP